MSYMFQGDMAPEDALDQAMPDMQPQPQPGDLQSPMPKMVSGPVGQDDYAGEVGIGPPNPDYSQFDAIDRDNINGLDDEIIKQIGLFCRDAAREGFNAVQNGGRFSNIALYRSIYECDPGDETSAWKWGCRLTPPDARVQTNTVTARKHDTILSDVEWVKVSSPNPDDDAACRKNVHYLMSQFGQQGPIKFPQKLGRTLRNMSVDGQVVWRRLWRTEKAKVRRRVVINNQFLASIGLPSVLPQNINTATIELPGHKGKAYRYGERVLWEEEKVVANHYDLEVKDIRDFFMWPANSNDVQKATIAGYFFYETPDEIRRHAADGTYDADAVEKLVGKLGKGFPRSFTGQSSPFYNDGIDNPNDSQEAEWRDGINRGHEQMSNEFGRRRMVCCYARIYDADQDTDLEEQGGTDSEGASDWDGGIMDDLCIIFEWTTGIVVHLQLNAYDDGERPFFIVSDDPRVGDGVYGYGVIEQLMDLQLELTAITRTGIDLGTQASTVIVEQNPGRRRLKDKGLVPGINFIDRAEDGDIVAMHQFKDVPSSNLFDRGDVRTMMEKASGANEVMQGVNPTGDSTLGETNLAYASGNTRMKFNLTFMMDALTWLYKGFFSYSRQFLEDSINYSVIVDGAIQQGQIDPQELAVTEYADISAYCPALDPSSAMRFQQAQQAFQAMANSPFVQGNYSRMGLILTDFLKNGLRVPYDLAPRIGTPEEWQQMDMAAQQAQQAVAAGAAGGQPGQPAPNGAIPPRPGGTDVAAPPFAPQPQAIGQ